MTVPEDTPYVEICIHVETKLYRDVVVTAQIGQNIGANHQATGSILFIATIYLTSIIIDCVSAEIISQCVYFTYTRTSAVTIVHKTRL